MANKAQLPLNLYVHVDGTSTTLTVNTITSPFLWGNSSSYNLAASIAGLSPSGTNTLSSSDGTGISATIGLLGNITFTWESAPMAGEVIIGGNIVF